MEDPKIPSPSTSPNTSSSPATPPPSLPPLNPNPYPTTFIQADTQSFKQVVQMLTGSAETTSKQQQQQQQQQQQAQQQPPPHKITSHHHHHHHHHAIPPINKPNKKPAFKLYERRPSMKNLKMISPLFPSTHPSFSPKPEILSPSILDFPSLVLSPVTPLSPDPFNRSPPQLVATPEDRAIADKGFYLHPSPRSITPRDGEPPKLLPLFPLSSPRMEAASASASSSAAELGL